MLNIIEAVFASVAIVATMPILPPEPIPVVEVQAPQVVSSQEEIVTQEIIRVFKEDAPIMLKVARCESGLRQFDEDGEVLVSHTSDSGVFQINQVHDQKLTELGLDASKLEDNVKYAKYLFDNNGTSDWSMSEDCWK